MGNNKDTARCILLRFVEMLLVRFVIALADQCSPLTHRGKELHVVATDILHVTLMVRWVLR